MKMVAARFSDLVLLPLVRTGNGVDSLLIGPSTLCVCVGGWVGVGVGVHVCVSMQMQYYTLIW